MKYQLARFISVLILVSISCGLPASPSTPTPIETPIAIAQLIIDAAPGSTATPTPFLPIGPTPTPAATSTPTPTSTPEPSPTPKGPTPFVIQQEQAGGTINILVMGSDYRPSSGYRTDVMILLSIHADEGTVSAVSFPRDLYVYIPGWMEQRINTAFPRGGFPMLAETLQYNFGVRPDYYVLTNFQGFIRLIDDVNGIVVDVGAELTDKCDLPQAVNTYCTVYPGPLEMDGATALWYVRSRYSSSDLDRTRRAQEVLLGLFRSLMSANAVARIPELYDTYRQNVETNLSAEDIGSMLKVALTVYNDPSRIRRYAIGAGHVYPYVTAEGAQVLLPNYAAIKQMIQEAVAP